MDFVGRLSKFNAECRLKKQQRRRRHGKRDCHIIYGILCAAELEFATLTLVCWPQCSHPPNTDVFVWRIMT